MRNRQIINDTAQHIRHNLAPEQYKALWQSSRHWAWPYLPRWQRSWDAGYFVTREAELEYFEYKRFWANIPMYVTARCPICHAPTWERLNTYSILHWDLQHAVFYHGGPEERQEGCEHFLLSDGFINLNGIIPVEIDDYSGPPEVPFVRAGLLEIPMTHLVMHSLPICQVEYGQFVPRFSLFMLSYFGTLASIFDKVPQGISYNYNKWITRSTLWWLDLNRRELPLKTGYLTEFPYSQILGQHTPYSENRFR